MGQYAQNPRSLESSYKGVLFRSRLEARWAALFDHYGLMWAYEPDVFQTRSGAYLPDFFLPSLNTYVEIKPAPRMADFVACVSVSDITGGDFLILDSPVISCRAYPLLHRSMPSGEGEWVDMSWCCSHRYMPGGSNFKNGEHRFYLSLGTPHEYNESGECLCTSYNRYFPGSDLILAEPSHFRRIRSMRFERGVAL